MTNINLNGSSLTFDQDKLISFDEATHTYTVADMGVFTPVSSVVGKFFEPFDAVYWSLNKCYGDEDAAKRLREEWECNGHLASQAGTFMHKQIEDYLNHRHDGAMQCTVSYDGKWVHECKQVDITPEWNQFLAFDRATTYEPFRTEWRVFDPEHRIAGTIDLLCQCDDGTFEIYDWKRSNKIHPDEINQWANGINGLEDLTDTAYSHYCMQQNLYRHILETYYGLRISRMNLVVLHPKIFNYRIVPVPRMEREVAIMLKNFR